MAEPDKKQSFWTTLPGILTGVAALLTAVTGFLVVVHPHGAGTRDSASVVGGVSGGTAGTIPTPTTGGSSGASGTAKRRATVLVVGKDGTESRVFLNSLRDSYSGEAIQFKVGQSIPFDKIGSIDFLDLHEYEQDLKVTLIDGRSLEGAIMAGEHITGDTDIGPFSVSVNSLKRISFER